MVQKWINTYGHSVAMSGIIFVFVMALISTALLLAFATVMKVEDRVYCGIEKRYVREGCLLPDDDEIIDRRIKRYDDIVINEMRNQSALHYRDFDQYLPVIDYNYIALGDELLTINKNRLEFSFSARSKAWIETEVKNFTDAVKSCEKKDGELLTINTATELEILNNHLRKNDEVFENCQWFITGYRSVIEELFSSPDARTLMPSNELSLQASNVYLNDKNSCIILSTKRQFTIRHVPCTQTSTCFVCDVGVCPDFRFPCHQYVNILWPPLDFAAANLYCKVNFPYSTGLGLFISAELSVAHKNFLTYVASNYLCSNHEYMALKARLSNLYEDSYGNRLGYPSKNIRIDNYKDHCVAVDRYDNLTWTSRPCFAQDCFICRKNS